jgi:hypothetical protein
MKEFVKALLSECKSNIVPERYNLFGWLVGEWDFEWIDGHGTPEERHLQGEWIFQWVLEGTAIQDIFICPSREARKKDYQADAAYATSVRMYNPDTKAWDIVYVELGSSIRLEARLQGRCIVQTVVGDEQQRWVFSAITPNSFHWQRLVWKDRQWVAEVDLYATRRA